MHCEKEAGDWYVVTDKPADCFGEFMQTMLAALAISLAPGDYWISSLNLDANAGDMRVHWDVPVKIEAGRAARVELSNLNTTEGISSNP